MHKAKGHFFKKFNPSSSKQFWKTVKILNKNNVSIPRPALERNGTTVTKDSDKASMLNQYFSECFNMAQPPLSNRYEEPNIGNCPEDLLCTKEEVYKMLLSLDTSKANGPDGISAKMLKGTALSITPVLTQLFNMSLQSGIFPEKWKLSSVVPIPKGGDRSNPSNYRPISLLSVVSKMLE